MDLAHYGPWAVVAGGSEGVGAAVALRLAQAGLHLVLVARRQEPLEQTAAACREHGVEVRTVPLDLTADDAVGRLLAATEGLEVGLLVDNAGANTCSDAFLDADLADVQRVLDLNVTTPLALVHAYARPMRERRRGGVLLVGSLAGYFGAVGHSAYGGAKAFSRVFAESLWLELLPHDVHVLHVVLGVTRTPAMERAGLSFDVPGMLVAEPDDVAREALAGLQHGPVLVAGGNGPTADKRSGPDRRAVVLSAHRAMLRLTGRTP